MGVGCQRSWEGLASQPGSCIGCSLTKGCCFHQFVAVGPLHSCYNTHSLICARLQGSLSTASRSHSTITRSKSSCLTALRRPLPGLAAQQCFRVPQPYAGWPSTCSPKDRPHTRAGALPSKPNKPPHNNNSCRKDQQHPKTSSHRPKTYCAGGTTHPSHTRAGQCVVCCRIDWQRVWLVQGLVQYRE